MSDPQITLTILYGIQILLLPGETEYIKQYFVAAYQGIDFFKGIRNLYCQTPTRLGTQPERT